MKKETVINYRDIKAGQKKGALKELKCPETRCYKVIDADTVNASIYFLYMLHTTM